MVRFLQGLGDNEALPLKLLSQKLVVLMALVEASRVSELHALNLRYWVYRPEGVIAYAGQEKDGRSPSQASGVWCLPR